MPRRNVDRAERQQFILGAARALFARHGIENSNMDAIAAASNYTRRTLYAYFQSREDILLQVHVEDLERRWAAQQQALAEVDGCPAQARAWGETLLGFWVKHPHCVRMEQYWDYHGIDRRRVGRRTFLRFKRLNNALVAGLEEIFRGGVEEGSLHPDLEIDLCISQFVTTVRSIAYRALSSGYTFAKFDRHQYMRHYVDLFLRGVRRENRNRRTAR